MRQFTVSRTRQSRLIPKSGHNQAQIEHHDLDGTDVVLDPRYQRFDAVRLNSVQQKSRCLATRIPDLATKSVQPGLIRTSAQDCVETFARKSQPGIAANTSAGSNY